MRNIRIMIEYDGTDFSGWQFQNNARTVQDEIQKAVFEITRESVAVNGAGRTDAGVHARGQVGNFKIEKRITDFDLKKGLNAVLPHDVRIRSLGEVPHEFHARFSARERMYRYYLSPEPVAVGRQYCWFYPHTLRLDVMNGAAKMCLGDHSFRAFCSVHAEVSHYRCQVIRADWTFRDGMIVFEVRANRFLHNMVRALVGTMIEAGRERITAADFSSILHSQDRTKARYTAPAAGLILEEVVYENAI